MVKSIQFPAYEQLTEPEIIQSILDCLQMYFEGLLNSDVNQFMESWHPKASIFNIGNSNDLTIDSIEEVVEHRIKGLEMAKKSIPNFDADFIISKIIRVEYRDVVATVEIEWDMIMPESIGKHWNSFHLAKIKGKWLILGVLDRGIEETINA